MRAFLAIICGFAFTLAVFGSGLAVATWFLATEPLQQANASLDVSDLWTREPRSVKPDRQNLQRLPARPDPALAAQRQPAVAAAADAPRAGTAAASPLDEGTAAPLDTATTGSIAPTARKEQQAPQTAGPPAAHVEWCARRYRSYRPQDNTYRPYSGGRRPCLSPYLTTAAAAGGEASANARPLASDAYAAEVAVEDEGDAGLSPEFDYAVADDAGVQVTSDHAAYCFSRYRSYRPEDNSYQPYGGGPRRQCE